jgi:hypothetical protein
MSQAPNKRRRRAKPTDHYVYRISGPTGTVRYIGKTDDLAAQEAGIYAAMQRDEHTGQATRLVRAMIAQGIEPLFETIHRAPRRQAGDLERLEIAKHKLAGHPLVNSMTERTARYILTNEGP